MTQKRCATEIGTKAHDLLSDSDRRWAVLAAVSGAIYIESDREEVLWIAGGRSALHGRAILISDKPSELPSSGTPCSVQHDCLHIGDELAIGLSDAAVWRPDQGGDGCVPEWSRRLADAIHRLALLSVPRGSLIRIAVPTLPDARSSSPEVTGVALAAAARRGIAVLNRVASGSDLLEGLERATELVGLGEGLTPSGDDFLGAFLFTLRVPDPAPQAPGRIDWQWVEAWLRRVQPLTNKISYAVLVDHAHGEAAAPLFALLHAAQAGSSRLQLVQLAGRVAEIGHSSGWDLLGGVYCANSAVSRMVEGSSQPTTCQYVVATRHGATSQAQCRKEVVRVY
jgi:hypothetical protein